MMLISGDRSILTMLIGLAVLTRYRIVTDKRTDRHFSTACYTAAKAGRRVWPVVAYDCTLAMTRGEVVDRKRK